MYQLYNYKAKEIDADLQLTMFLYNDDDNAKMFLYNRKMYDLEENLLISTKLKENRLWVHSDQIYYWNGVLYGYVLIPQKAYKEDYLKRLDEEEKEKKENE